MTTKSEAIETVASRHALRAHHERGWRSWAGTHASLLMLAGVFVLVCIVFTIFTDSFASSANLINLLRQTAPLLIVGAAMTMVITTTGIDLSVGSGMAFIGVSGAWLLNSGTPVLVVFLAMLALGAAIGLINGIFVARYKVPALIVTLAGFTGYQGFTLLVTGGRSIKIESGLWSELGRGTFLGLPNPVWLALVLVGAMWYVFNKTSFGLHVVAVGSNEEGSRRSGVKTSRVLIGVYVLSGITAAIAGIIIAGRLGTGSSDVGQFFELSVITGVVLGGTSLFGGRGTIAGSVIGILLFAIITNGLILMGVSPFWSPVMQGVALLLAALAHARLGSRRTR